MRQKCKSLIPTFIDARGMPCYTESRNAGIAGTGGSMRYYYQVRGGCVLCLMCVYECKVGAIRIEENRSVVIDETRCVGCGRCADNCQAEAIVRVERT